ADVEEKRARLTELKKERLATKVVEAKDRVERNPTDPQLRFSYASLLYETEDFTAAIPELQRAKSKPHVRIKALLMLGKCFDKKNMLDMAVNQLEEADKELHGMDGTKKELLYEKGVILEKMGKKDEALEAFKLIYEADYGFLDVAQRVESSYS
ncbi:MAG: tetratricopeptide repeat protein, partial [Verrucomicrobiota bacterium]